MDLTLPVVIVLILWLTVNLIGIGRSFMEGDDLLERIGNIFLYVLVPDAIGLAVWLLSCLFLSKLQFFQ